MRQSEFDKITAALGRAEFAMDELRTRADELRRKSNLAKSFGRDCGFAFRGGRSFAAAGKNRLRNASR